MPGRIARNGVPERARIELRYRANVGNSTEAINDAVHTLVARLHRYGLADGVQAEVEIALREALANAVFHGNRAQPERRVLLRAYGQRGCGILLAIRDEGPGFDPAAVPDPRAEERLELTHGRGIFLMHALMDRVEYRRNGREVLLWKRPHRRALQDGMRARKK